MSELSHGLDPLCGGGLGTLEHSAVPRTRSLTLGMGSPFGEELWVFFANRRAEG